MYKYHGSAISLGLQCLMVGTRVGEATCAATKKQGTDLGFIMHKDERRSQIIFRETVEQQIFFFCMCGCTL